MPEMNDIDIAVTRLLHYILGNEKKINKKLYFIIGAGVSKEYNIPTTWELAKYFFEQNVVNISAEELDELIKNDEVIPSFIDKFINELNNDLQYSVFNKFLAENRKLPQKGDSITLERIIDLWSHGFVKMILTSNFDYLIEDAFERFRSIGNNENIRSFLLDYSDLQKSENIPTTLDGLRIVKLCGSLATSNMLWSQKQFKKELTDNVMTWVKNSMSETAIVSLGQTLSEKPLNDTVRSLKSEYLVSVDPKMLDQIDTLKKVNRVKKNTHYHVPAKAGAFIEALYERLYKETKIQTLELCVASAKDKALEIHNSRQPLIDKQFFITTAFFNNMVNFINEKGGNRRWLMILADSGFGKSVNLYYLSSYLNSLSNMLCIYIPARELSDTIQNWMTRFKHIDLDRLVRSAAIQNLGVTIVVDGLNETERTTCGNIINSITSILDKYTDGSVKVITSVRPEYWSKAEITVDRNYIRSDISPSEFSDYEIEDAFNKLNIIKDKKSNRNYIFYNLIRKPQNYSYIVKYNLINNNLTSLSSLYRIVTDKIAADEQQRRALIKLMSLMLQQKKSEIRVFDVKNSVSLLKVDEEKNISTLTEKGILCVPKNHTIRFNDDILTEYVFGSIYLLDLFEQSDSNIIEFMISFNHEVNLIENTEFRLFCQSAILFFIQSLDEKHKLKLYKSDKSELVHLARVAFIESRQCPLNSDTMNDPLMLAVAMLSPENFDKIFNLAISADIRLSFNTPFNFAAKIYPDSFITFTFYLLEKLKKLESPENNRQAMNIFLACTMIMFLRCGIDRINKYKTKKLIIFLRSLPEQFLAERLCELFESNNSYLFYSHATDKLSDLCSLDYFTKETLKQAINGGVSSLKSETVFNLSSVSSAVRLLLYFLIRFEDNNGFYQNLSKSAFSKNDLRLQDFILTILGFETKRNLGLIEFNKQMLDNMFVSSKENFYAANISNDEHKDSQYDPIVPYFSTLLYYGLPLGVESFLSDSIPANSFRLGRLAQKTFLDFPAETIKYLFENKDKLSFDDEEVKTSLDYIKYFFPSSYWRELRKYDTPILPMDAFSLDEHKNTRIIGQLRDYDWFSVINYIKSDPIIYDALKKFFLTLLDNDDMAGSILAFIRQSKTR